MSDHLRLVAPAVAPDVCRIIHQDVELIANEVMSAACDVLELRRTRGHGDLKNAEDALVRLGTHLRASLRLWLGIAEAIEARREDGR